MTTKLDTVLAAAAALAAEKSKADADNETIRLAVHQVRVSAAENPTPASSTPSTPRRFRPFSRRT